MSGRRVLGLASFALLFARVNVARAGDPAILPPDDTLAPPPPPFVPPPPPPSTAPPPPAPYVQPAGPRVAYRIEGGATFSKLYDIPIRGGEITAGVGSEFVHDGAAYLSVTFFGGAQETGLAAFHLHVDGDLELRVGPARIGAGVSVGYLGLGGAVGGDTFDLAPTFGAFAFLSVDVVQWGGARECDRRAVYLQGRLRGDVAVGGDATPGFWGPSFGAGIRF